MRKGQRRWLWLALGAIVLGLIVYHLGQSPEWRDFEWRRLAWSLAHARPGLLLAALAATYTNYLVRAYRWKFFLDPIKKGSLWILFVGQILGFSSIYLIGRPGELVRPAYIAKKENVAFSSMLAVWLLERLYDMVFLLFLFGMALYLAPLDPRTARGKMLMVMMRRGGVVMLVSLVVFVVALAGLRWHAEKMKAGSPGEARLLPGRAFGRFEQTLQSFAAGLGVIRDWKSFLASAVSTVVLWVINGSVYWFAFQSLGGKLAQLPWQASVVVMCFAGLGLAVQFPGVGGGFQVGMILALRELYSVGVEPSTGAAILVWILILVPCLALGLVMLTYEGLTFKKLGAMAEEGRAATAGKA